MGPITLRYAVVSAACVLAPLQSVMAQPEHSNSDTKTVETLTARLHSAPIPTAMSAARRLGRHASRAAEQALLGLLRVGAPPELTLATLKALKGTVSSASVQLLAHYARHRRESIATEALGLLGHLLRTNRSLSASDSNTDRRRLGSAIYSALKDARPRVRNLAAQLIVMADPAGAESALLKLIKRHHEVPVRQALSRVATSRTVTRLEDAIRKAANLTAVGKWIALSRSLLLSSTFGPDPLRERLIQALRGTQTTAAWDVLRAFVSKTNKNDPRSSVRMTRVILRKPPTTIDCIQHGAAGRSQQKACPVAAAADRNDTPSPNKLSCGYLGERLREIPQEQPGEHPTQTVVRILTLEWLLMTWHALPGRCIGQQTTALPLLQGLSPRTSIDTRLLVLLKRPPTPEGNAAVAVAAQTLQGRLSAGLAPYLIRHLMAPMTAIETLLPLVQALAKLDLQLADVALREFLLTYRADSAFTKVPEALVAAARKLRDTPTQENLNTVRFIAGNGRTLATIRSALAP